MLKDFSKLNTFLTVVETKSFSKASKKLGISQPAVTQQIKIIEQALKKTIIDRKKSGIILTPEGEELRRIALKLKKNVEIATKDLQKIIGNHLPLRLGACITIGEYIFPSILAQLQESFKSNINITIEPCKDLEEKLQDRRLDFLILSQPSFLDGTTYKEWIDDEIVVFSNTPLPQTISFKELSSFKWIYREEDSHTRKIAQDTFESKGLDCDNIFDDVQMIFNNITAVKNAVIKTPKDGKQVVSLASKYVIEEEVKNGILYASKIKACNLNRKLYLAYATNKKEDKNIKELIRFFNSIRSI